MDFSECRAPRRVPRHDGAASPGSVGGPPRVRERPVHGAPRRDRALRSRRAGFSRRQGHHGHRRPQSNRHVHARARALLRGVLVPKVPAHAAARVRVPRALARAGSGVAPGPLRAQPGGGGGHGVGQDPVVRPARRRARQRAAVLGREKRRRPHRGRAGADARARRADRVCFRDVRQEQQNRGRLRVRRRAEGAAATTVTRTKMRNSRGDARTSVGFRRRRGRLSANARDVFGGGRGGPHA